MKPIEHKMVSCCARHNPRQARPFLGTGHTMPALSVLLADEQNPNDSIRIWFCAFLRSFQENSWDRLCHDTLLQIIISILAFACQGGRGMPPLHAFAWLWPTCKPRRSTDFLTWLRPEREELQSAQITYANKVIKQRPYVASTNTFR